MSLTTTRLVGIVFAAVRTLGLFGALSAVGCGGGGGGGSTSGPLHLLGVRTDSGSLLPVEEVFLNETLTFLFSEDVDPSTVDADSIRIRRRRIADGRPSGSVFSVSARGEFFVFENEVTFVPDLPTRGDASDAGFLRDTLYRLELSAAPEFDVVRAVGGLPLGIRFETTFRTRTDDPLVLDPVPGPPRVIAVTVDLDGDGVLEADGDPETEDPEEFFEFDRFPFLTEVPLGLASQPVGFGFLMSEPVLTSSLMPLGGVPGVGNAFLWDAANSARLPTRLLLTQEFRQELGRFFVRIELVPRTILPSGSRIEPTLEGIEDLSLRPMSGNRFRTGFDTQVQAGRVIDRLVETFEDRDLLDPSSTAEWNTNGTRALLPGLGVGGTGVDGEFDLGPDVTARLDTRVNGGFFNFTSFRLAEGSVLEVVGPNPLVVFSQSEISIGGTIDVSGTDGEDFETITGDRPALPGIAVAGGTNGGLGGIFGFIPGAGPRGVGGGEGGHSNLGNPGGGGGGGHSFLGGTFSTVGNRWAGLGGSTYGSPRILVLYAGSGGGGGGDYRRGKEFGLGGGGGAGGGALSFNSAGKFELLASGALLANGGNGGDGGPGGVLFGAGGGGGGSGGSIRIRAGQVEPIVLEGARITAQGGSGGRTGGGFIGPGGGGADGRIFIETFDANRDGLANDFEIDPILVRISPTVVQGILSTEDLGKSFALSRFMDTGAVQPSYSFNGSDPVTGELRASASDIVLRREIRDGISAVILFQGAAEHPERPRSPDLDSTTEFTPRIEDLNGYPFIRYRIDFDLGENLEGDARPVVEELSIQVEFDL